MSRLKKIQPNVPQLKLGDYVTTIYGEPKAGKTTLAYNIGLEHFGTPEKTLLIGFEDGYKALPNIYAESVKDWRDFLELKEELIENKDEHGFELLIFDTVDIMSDMAASYIVKRESRADSKKYNSLADIPWGRGSEQLKVEIRNAIDELQKNNFGIQFITHSKDKKIEPKVGTSYDTTTLSLNGKVLDVIKNISDFIVYISIEREKVAGKTESKRYMYFRSDTNLEAGSRFKHVPEKVEYGAKQFLEVFKGAVEGATADYKRADGDVAAPKVSSQKEVTGQDFDEQEFESYIHTENTEELDGEELIASVKTELKQLDAEEKIKIQKFMLEEFGTKSPSKLTEVSQFKAIQNQINAL